MWFVNAAFIRALYLHMCECRCKSVDQNGRVKYFPGFGKFMVDPSLTACFFCCWFWVVFFQGRKMSHSYLHPTLKKDCISTIMWAISFSIFNLEQLPAAQIFCLAGLQEGWDFAARDLFEDNTWRHPATVALHVGAWGRTEPHLCPLYQTPQQREPCLPVWWGLLPAGGFCDQPPHLGAAATTSGGCPSASECPPGAQGSSGSAPSPSSSHLHIRPCGNCTLLREPSGRIGDMSAQLTPHQLRAKRSSYSPPL